MFEKQLHKHSLEVLESRIAPAAVVTPALPSDPNAYIKATFDGGIELHAGQVLTTSGQKDSGSYLLFVEKGNALVFCTDLNNNKAVDFNEITGIAAGDGLRLVSYVDIHGDIVTNLKEETFSIAGQSKLILSLSDSDTNAANDDATHSRGDGRVLLNKTIEKIELRSLRPTEIGDQNNDGIVDLVDVALRQAPSTYSIFGNIYAGKGFGVASATGFLTSGLIIDPTNLVNFGFEASTIPMIGSIKTGTAASGEHFSFGVSRADDIEGTIVPFVPPRGQAGGDIIGVGSVAGSTYAVSGATPFLINTLHAGNGGVGARGGNVQDVFVDSDDSGGYEIIAGNGGTGSVGGAGGSIINFSDFGSITSKVVIRSGDGAFGKSSSGGNGGTVTFQTFNIRGNVSLELGDGGDGFVSGGDGASLAAGVFTQPQTGTAYDPGNGYGTTHLASSLNGVYSPVIGTHQAVDFDGDGFGDFAFTTKTTSQLVVIFGNGVGGFRTQIGPDGQPEFDRVYLSGARNAEAITVADLNGDGHPDIAVGSGDVASHAGVAVFLAKFEHNGIGTLTAAEDKNGNGKNDFVGFYDVRFSNLPQLQTGDPGTPMKILPFWESPVQINALTAGDFDGDGRPELAVVVTYYGRKLSDADTNVTTSLSGEAQVLMFLTPDVEVDSQGNSYLTGQFYADFGTKFSQTPNGSIPADPHIPFVILAGPTPAAPAQSGFGGQTVVIEASALSGAAGHDVVFAAVKGAKAVNVIDYSSRTSVFGFPTPPTLSGIALGKVDVDRLQSAYTAEYQDLTFDFTAAEATKGSDGLELQNLTALFNTGTYTLTFNGVTTAALPFNASPAAVQTALNGIIPLPLRVQVQPDPLRGGYAVSFNQPGDQPAILITATPTSVVATELIKGSAGQREIQDFKDNSPTGTYTLTYGIGAAAQTTGALPVNADAATIQSELNSLSTIIADGGVNVAPDGQGGFTVTFNTFNDKPQIVLQAKSAPTPDTEIIQGSPGVKETQAFSDTFNVTYPAGAFTLTFGGNTTVSIPVNASAATIQSALNALPSIVAAGGVTVTNNVASSTFRIVFNKPNDVAAITGQVTYTKFKQYQLDDAHIDMQDMQVGDFTVVDYNNDGKADLGVIAPNGAAAGGIMIGIKGDGVGGGTPDSTTPAPNSLPAPTPPSGLPANPPLPPEPVGQNAGNFFGGNGFGLSPTLFAIRSGDVDADGQLDDMIVFHDLTPGPNGVAFLVFQPGAQPEKPSGNPLTQTTGALLNTDIITFTDIASMDEVLFDLHFNSVANLSAPAYVAANQTGSAPPLPIRTLDIEGPFLGSTFSSQPLGEVGLKLTAGDGGDGLVGRGGNGGFLGSGAKLITTIDPLTGLSTSTYKGSLDFVLSGNVRFTGGQGGDGFSRGGNGGSISGVTVLNSDPQLGIASTLTGGNGGRGVSGAGGDGGSISQSSVDGGILWTAGNGGQGSTGGKGGSIFGNGSGVYDSRVGTTSISSSQALLQLFGGKGGEGIKRGGDGGSISGFTPIVNGTTGIVNGALQYIAGDGGNAISGPGGDGGSILNSSPKTNATIENEIDLEAGDGGRGTTGGRGGSISNFVVKLQAQSKNPSVVSFLAGHGGAATVGNGGAGGNIVAIDVTAFGNQSVPTFTAFDFNRALAGNGGFSAGGAGGAGGGITNFRSSAVDGAYAVTSGAGGAGLTAGGKGGDLNTVDISMGASTVTKTLVVAGAGGDAYAFIPNSSDATPNQSQNAFGGRVGKGGDGGDITGYKQRGSQTAHADLIAGNGGSTINYGTIGDKVSYVGNGGSVRTVEVAGDIGNIGVDVLETGPGGIPLASALQVNQNVAILSYNKLNLGETMAQYVQEKFRDGTRGFTLTDGDGNVGIVVGAAGRNKGIELDPVNRPNDFETQPSSNSRAGSLVNLTTRNLMSAVAGSVDRIAAIYSAQNIAILGGTVGTDKGSVFFIDPVTLLPVSNLFGEGTQFHDVKNLDPVTTPGSVVGIDYLDTNGNSTKIAKPVERDGKLIDGALVTHELINGGTSLIGRVYFL